MQHLLERLELLEAKGKVTGATIKRALKTENLSLDFRDKSIMSRVASVAPGISVHETRKTKIVKGQLRPSGESTYWATAYLGKDSKPSRYDASSNTTDLKVIVAWVNQRRENSEQHWKAEGG